MPKIIESKPADFLDSFDVAKLPHRVKGSPTRFLEIYEHRLRKMTSQSIDFILLDAEDPLTHTREFALQLIDDAKYTRLVDGKGLDAGKIANRIQWGAANAFRKWVDIESQINGKLTILEVMLIARAWVDNREGGILWKREQETAQSREIYRSRQRTSCENQIAKDRERLNWLRNKIKTYEQEASQVLASINESKRNLYALWQSEQEEKASSAESG